MKLKNIPNEMKQEIRESVSKTTKPMAKKVEQVSPLTEFENSYSVKTFKSKSINQKEIVKSISDKEITITVVYGKPGTGKTYSAIQGALTEFKSGTYNKIYLSKSVKTLDNKSEDIGFLKGTMEDKIAPFMFSYDFNFKQIIDPVAYDNAKAHGIIEFLPLAYIRGIGLRDCIVILDECQNINTSILRTVLSRMGKNSKLIIMGDTQQKDSANNYTSGLHFLIKHFSDIEGFKFIEMGKEDQSRSPLINLIEDRFDDLENTGVKID